jgi:glycosyltransferase involved in cell wall biosynthesis
MRIAGIDPELNFGGGEVQVMGLTCELLRAGHDAELFCNPDGELWKQAGESDIPCYPLPIRNSLDPVAGLRLRARLTRHRYDIVHFHTARAHAMAPYAFGQTATLVVTRRMDYVPNRLFSPWLYNHAVDGVAAISGGVARALISAGVAPEHITIIPSGVDCTHFAPPDEATRQQARNALGLLPGDVAVGTAGALVARKGHWVLIDAMANACRGSHGDNATETAGSRLRCFIAGAGPLQQELAHRIQQKHMARDIMLLGQIRDTRALLHALDIFVMPSLHEGMGVAALEASAVGLPIVASAVGGLAEVVDNQRMGLLVQPADPAGLANALTRLAVDHGLRSTMGRASRERAVRNWSMELMARRTLNFYEACSRGPVPEKALEAPGKTT